MSWALVEKGSNPSSDYFVKPVLQDDGFGSFDLQARPNKVSLGNASNVVFVRYLSSDWVKWVESHRKSVKRIAFFMDDDLFDLKAHSGLPLKYRWRLYQNTWKYRSWLRRVDAELWVSNDWLADKYKDWNPRVLQPQSPYGGVFEQGTFFYHGSASHTSEIHWLVPVVEDVLVKTTNLSFEIIGNAQVRSYFSHLERVHVVQPMSWESYRALISRPGRSIGLAPLMPSRFNMARSATKFFDITHAGAVGIFADDPVYRSIVTHGDNGLLLNMDQQSWVDAILQLHNDEPGRLKILNQARLLF